MGQSAGKTPQPPQPPEVGRSFRTTSLHVTAVLVFSAIVALALADVFGESHETKFAEESLINLEVTYPTRFRYKMIDEIEVAVENAGEEPLQTLTVRFDRSYIDAFSTVSFTPSPSAITEDAYLVELRDLQAGQTKYVSVGVQAEQYWQHEGFVEVESGAGSPVVELSTIVYP